LGHYIDPPQEGIDQPRFIQITIRCIEDAKENGTDGYSKNDYDRKQSQDGGSNQVIPEDIEQLDYSMKKVESTGEMIEGLADQAEGM
jgi:hypothetical protein